MGYYSEVAIKLSKKANERATDNLKVRDALKQCGAEKVRDLKDGGVVYHIENIKWYSDFDEIAAIEGFLKSLDAEKEEFYEFMRLGEDENDNEHDWNGEVNDMFVNRSINFDFCV